MEVTSDFPVFSMVTVVYNGAREIEKTLSSCLSQDYVFKEYIVVDGASTDNTPEIIKKYSDRISCIISEPDNGIYDAMNKAIKVATGDWILFMNCGDYFIDSSVLSGIATAIIEMDTEPDIIYGNTLFRYKNSFLKTTPMPLEKIEREMVFCHQSSLVRTNLIKTTLFDIKHRYAADYEMMLKFFLQKREFRYLDLYISVFNQEDGNSLRNYVKSTKERYSVQKDNGSVTNSLILCRTLLRMGIGLFVKRILPVKLNDYFFQKKYRNRLV